MLGSKFNSPSFHTSTDGYNICIDVYPNGRGHSIGTHVSVFVYFLNSCNDKNLTWPFIGTVEIELLNQLADQNHHLRRLAFTKETDTNVGKGRKGRGFNRFIAHYKLHTRNAQYLRDDTLYFRISVTECKHWMEHLKKQAHS